jgi:hypothetical protein
VPIDKLLGLLDELRKADIRLAGTSVGTPERRAAWREVRRIEREAFGGVLSHEHDTRIRRPAPAFIL